MLKYVSRFAVLWYLNKDLARDEASDHYYRSSASRTRNNEDIEPEQ